MTDENIYLASADTEWLTFDGTTFADMTTLHGQNNIRTFDTAISDEGLVYFLRVNTELNYFIDNGFTVLKRAEILGKITENTFCLAVAGTHGKTTTSSILGHIMQPSLATSFLGGITENYNSNLILGEDKISVVEADEFDRSFLQLSPDVACVTSMDADHLDIYGEADALEQSFRDFANKVSETLIVAKGLPLKGLTYAINEEADYKAFNVKIETGKYVFDVKTPSSEIKNIEFQLPGKHNMMNALAALAMAEVYGVSLEEIKEQLKTFKGVQRRFSYKIKTDSLVLIDDYAHHPTEINAVVDAVQEMYPNEKIMGVFQPHLYSRTKDFIEDFALSLSRFDKLVLLDIYPARELPIEGVTSEWLLGKVDLINKKIVFLFAFLLFYSLNITAQDTQSNFWDHVRFGGGLGLNFGDGFFSATVAPSAIYEFSLFCAKDENVDLLMKGVRSDDYKMVEQNERADVKN